MKFKAKEIIKWLLFVIIGNLSFLRKKSNAPLCLNIIGDIYSESGLGNITRSLIRSIDTKVKVNLINLPMSVQSRQHSNTLPKGINYELESGINVFIGNPDILLRAFGKLSLVRLLGNYNVGLWFWELEIIPAGWKKANKIIDEVWVQSKFVQQAFSDSCEKTLVMPFNLDHISPSKKSRRKLGLPNLGRLIVFVFDFLSHAARKNPDLAIDVFKKAFQDKDNVYLIIKTVNGDKNKQIFDKLKARIGSRKNIILIDEYWELTDVARLIELADCYVSFHRAEGLGLTLAEAMRLRTLVLATGYSGNLEFMSADNSLLVNFNLTEIPRGQYPYIGKNIWAEADFDDAVTKMRLALSNENLSGQLVAKASLKIASYDSNNQWRWISDRVNEITKLN